MRVTNELHDDHRQIGVEEKLSHTKSQRSDWDKEAREPQQNTDAERQAESIDRQAQRSEGYDGAKEPPQHEQNSGCGSHDCPAFVFGLVTVVVVVTLTAFGSLGSTGSVSPVPLAPE